MVQSGKNPRRQETQHNRLQLKNIQQRINNINNKINTQRLAKFDEKRQLINS
jgi:hypothetical protein